MTKTTEQRVADLEQQVIEVYKAIAEAAGLIKRSAVINSEVHKERGKIMLLCAFNEALARTTARQVLGMAKMFSSIIDKNTDDALEAEVGKIIQEFDMTSDLKQINRLLKQSPDELFGDLLGEEKEIEEDNEAS